MRKGMYLLLFLLVVFLLAVPVAASHQPDPDPSPELQVVGQYPVLVDDLTSDVWAYGNYAYIGSYISVV